MLEPKKTKYRKHHRGNRKGMAKGGNYVAFGSYGLKPLNLAGLLVDRLKHVVFQSLA